jgi:hypothetical protein
MKKWFKNGVWFLPGIITGAIAGYFYWKFYGCDGTCMITSNPWRTTVYFALMGGLLNNMFKPNRKSDEIQNKSSEHQV